MVNKIIILMLTAFLASGYQTLDAQGLIMGPDYVRTDSSVAYLGDEVNKNHSRLLLTAHYSNPERTEFNYWQITSLNTLVCTQQKDTLQEGDIGDYRLVYIVIDDTVYGIMDKADDFFAYQQHKTSYYQADGTYVFKAGVSFMLKKTPSWMSVLKTKDPKQVQICLTDNLDEVDRVKVTLDSLQTQHLWNMVNSPF